LCRSFDAFHGVTLNQPNAAEASRNWPALARNWLATGSQTHDRVWRGYNTQGMWTALLAFTGGVVAVGLKGYAPAGL
jgi:hypothetical protein